MNVLKDKILYSKEEFKYGDESGRFVYRILDSIQEELVQHGDRDWLVDLSNNKTLRISEIAEGSRKVASSLNRIGFKRGDILQCFMPSNLDFYFPIFGAWLCGGVASFSNPSLSRGEIESIVNDTKPKVIVTSISCLHDVLSINEKLGEDKAQHVFVIDGESDDGSHDGVKGFRAFFADDDGLACPPRSSLAYDPRDDVVIHWTSGTTGMPKGVVHSSQYIHRIRPLSRTVSMPPKSNLMTSCIMFHAVGFALPIDAGIFHRITIFFIGQSKMEGDQILQCVSNHKINMLGIGYAIFTKIVNTPVGDLDLSSLKNIMITGSAVHPKYINQAWQCMPELSSISLPYGSTEVGYISLTTMKPEEAGLSLLAPDVKMYIRDLETGERLGPGKSGEIMVHTPSLMVRYHNRPEETADFWDEEGFARTGDFGDYDEQGNIYYRERIKEMIKFGAMSYYTGPIQFEEVILKISKVHDCAVFGETNHQKGYDDTHAAIVLTPEAKMSLKADQATMSASEAEEKLLKSICEEANANLPGILKITGKLFIIEQMPTNALGKKMRKEVKKMFLNQ